MSTLGLPHGCSWPSLWPRASSARGERRALGVGEGRVGVVVVAAAVMVGVVVVVRGGGRGGGRRGDGSARWARQSGAAARDGAARAFGSAEASRSSLTSESASRGAFAEPRGRPRAGT